MGFEEDFRSVSDDKKSIHVQKPVSISDPILIINHSDEEGHTRSYHFSICHQIPERSIHLNGKPLLCYRCFGNYLAFFGIFLYQIIGLLVGFSLIFFPIRLIFIKLVGSNIWFQLLVIILLHIPMMIDGVYQAMDNDYESKNWLRFVTGVLAGTGQVCFILFTGSIYFSYF